MVNKKTTPKASFSKIAFISILCLTLITFLGLGWQTWRSNKNIKTFHAQDFRIQELIGTIIHLDEVLTMSAHMGTKTGDFKWEERYLKFEPQLGAAINEAKRLVPAAFILKAAIQTDTANTKLVAMEKRAFELVRQGQKEEASAILFSEEYQGQKQIYAQGMKQVKASMQDHITDALKEHRRHEFFTIVTILTVLPVLFFAFIYIILLTRRRYVIDRTLSEDKLEKHGILFDNISDLVYICDTEENVLFLNKMFEKFSGHKPEEFIGKSFAPLFNGEDLKKAIDLYSRTLKGESPQQEICFKDTGILCEYKSIPLRDERGNITGVIGIARDITERKRLEDELKESNRTLEERVTERTKEIAKANEELQIKITERKHADEKLVKYQTQLKRLSSALSLAEERERRHIAGELHDRIGQTLTVIKMKLVDIQETQIYTDTDSVLKETRELLDQAIQDTRTLTFELSPPILYELGFEPAVEWLVDQFKKQHNIAIDFVGGGLTGLGFDPGVEWLIDQFKKQQNVAIDFGGGGLTGMLEEDVSFFLFKSVRELLFNVIKHARAHRIKVTLLRKDNKIKIYIDDDGVGFDFSKAQFSVNDLSGFGLFSIRERMEHLGGNLDVKSKPGHGTCVTLTMPLKQQEGDAGAK